MATSEEPIVLSAHDLLHLDAAALQSGIAAVKLSSEDLVRSALCHIQNHEGKLNAMISLTRKESVLTDALRLDDERRKGQLRGPMHGIPIIVTDSVATGPELRMPTTCGSYALRNGKVKKKKAKLIDKFIESGATVLGKANLTEFCNMKADALTPGWYPVGGQTRSAWIDGPIHKDQGHRGPTVPGGSSTGSAVGVSAGYAPISIGQETDGSLVQPAARNGLFALKPGLGRVSREGIWVVSHTVDSLGGMAKSVADLSAITEALLDTGDNDFTFKPSFPKDFENFRIGALEPDVWKFPDTYLHPIADVKDQIKNEFRSALSVIENNKGYVLRDVNLMQASKLTLNNEPALNTVLRHEYGQHVDEYLEKLLESPVRSLAELVDWNVAHTDLELPKDYPNQKRLLDALNHRPSLNQYEEAKNFLLEMTRRGENGIDSVLQRHNLDLIVMPMDSQICTITSAAGVPIATMPYGYLNYNGRPFGFGAVSKASKEDLLIDFMNAFEACFPKLRVPERILKTKGTEDLPKL